MTEDTQDIVEAIRALRAMGATRVEFKGCDVTFAELPMRATQSREDAEAEYQRIALASSQ